VHGMPTPSLLADLVVALYTIGSHCMICVVLLFKMYCYCHPVIDSFLDYNGNTYIPTYIHFI